LVFCGHEYTVNNLKFALSVEPDNLEMIAKMAWAAERRSKKIPTVPSTIGEEKDINPFMRVTLPDIQSKVGAEDAVECMKNLRAMKDKF
jgi:hydroxyacylglutathione hydrolase